MALIISEITDEIKNELQRVQDTLTDLVAKEFFLGYITSQWENIVPAKEIDTFATSSDTLLFNPEFSKGLTRKQLRFVILHELGHLFYLHPLKDRTKIRDEILALAEEQVVNEFVLKFAKDYNLEIEEFAPPISPIDIVKGNTEPGTKGYIYDPKLDNLDVVEIYEILKQNHNPQKCPMNSKKIVMVLTDDVIESESDSRTANNQQSEDTDTVIVVKQKNQQDDQQEEQSNQQQQSGQQQDNQNGQEEVRKQLMKAKTILVAEQLKKKGFETSSLKRLVENLKKPIVNWKRVLKRYMNDIFSSDISRTYSKQRGRSERNKDYILPVFTEKKIEGVNDIVIAVDTSGSISDKELNRFLSEIASILKDVSHKVSIITCDAEIKEVHTDVDLKKLPTIKITGGGGTDFRPVFRYLDAQKRKPKVLIYLTDGYGDFPERKPRYETIFAINNIYVDPPFGRTLRIIENS
ncbi:MAG: VWA-like domain-containing protein [Nitrososphaerota archaeon]